MLITNPPTTRPLAMSEHAGLCPFRCRREDFSWLFL